MLHKMQPARMRYLRQKLFERRLAPSSGSLPSSFRVLDIGCGGGLVSEALARLGAKVTAIDSSRESVLVAQRHAEERGLSIDYRHMALEDMETDEDTTDEDSQGEGAFDLLCAMEVIEHVEDPRRFLRRASRLLKKEGLFVLSTLNRTTESWVKGIVVAERVLGLLPRGTHDWEKFVSPEEMALWGEEAGLKAFDFCGMRYRVREGAFVLDPACCSFNYLAAFCRSSANERECERRGERRGERG